MAVSRSRARLARPLVVAALAVAFCLAPRPGAAGATAQLPLGHRRGLAQRHRDAIPAGDFVTDLPQDAFTVYEDGMPQEIRFFNRSNLPIALSILLDTSASMEDKLATAQEAAVGFVKRLRAAGSRPSHRLRQPRAGLAVVHEQHA